MPNREQDRIILGVDPGSRITGFGLIHGRNSDLRHIESGCIRLEKEESMARKLRLLHKELSAVIQEFEPKVLALETVFTAKNIKSAISLSHARGVVMLAAGQNQVPVYEYSPTEIKMSIVGYGRATKDQVMTMVAQLLRLKITASDKRDRFDALAAAICHASGNAFAEKVAKADRKTSKKGLEATPR